METVCRESDSKKTLDLSHVGDKLEMVFKQYPAASRRCDYCAREIFSILEQLGYQVELVRLNGPFGAAYLRTKSGTQVTNQVQQDTIRANHFVTKITTLKSEEFYIDAVVYEELQYTSQNLEAVPWELYQQLWQYDDIFEL